MTISELPAPAGLEHPLPRVSVVIPAYRAAGALASTLDSVLAQDYGGEMETAVAVAVEEQYAATVALIDDTPRFASVRHVDNPDGRTPAALNRAIEATSGEIIVRVDTHAQLPTDYVSTAVRTIRETGAAVVGGRQVSAGRSFMQRAIGMALTSPAGSGDSRYKVGGPPGPTDTVYMGIFRREALLAVGGFDEQMERNQDYELNWRIREAGGVVWFNPELYAEYQPRRSLGALASQYFQYGQWKHVSLRRHPKSLKPRQLAPPALVLTLLLSLVMAGCTASIWSAVVPVFYAGFLGMAALVELVRKRDAAALLLPVVLTVMHLGWGIGVMVPARPPRNASSLNVKSGVEHADSQQAGN